MATCEVGCWLDSQLYPIWQYQYWEACKMRIVNLFLLMNLLLSNDCNFYWSGEFISWVAQRSPRRNIRTSSFCLKLLCPIHLAWLFLESVLEGEGFELGDFVPKKKKKSWVQDDPSKTFDITFCKSEAINFVLKEEMAEKLKNPWIPMSYKPKESMKWEGQAHRWWSSKDTLHFLQPLYPRNKNWNLENDN